MLTALVVFSSTRCTQLDQLVPVVVGPLYQTSWGTAAHPMLAGFRAVPLPGTPALNIPVFPDPNATTSTTSAAPVAAQPAAEGAPASAVPAPGKHRPVPAEAPDSLLDPDAIAETYLHMLRQPRSAWSWEIEVRPWVEKF